MTRVPVNGTQFADWKDKKKKCLEYQLMELNQKAGKTRKYKLLEYQLTELYLQTGKTRKYK